MAFQPCPATAQLLLKFGMPNGTRAVNVLNVRKIGVGLITTGELTTLADFINGIEASTLKLCRSNEVSYDGCELRSLEAEVAPYWDGTLPAPILGSVASPALSNNVTVAVKFSTGETGRSSRGRAFHVGLAESMVSGNFLSGTWPGDIVDAWEIIRNDMLSDTDFALAVLSRFTGGALRSNGIASPVASVSMSDSRVDTQRRRLPRLYS